MTISAKSPNEFIVHSHAGDDWKVCQDYVASRLGRGAFRPRRETARNSFRQAAPDRKVHPCPNDDEGHQRVALAIWHEARDPRGTIVETYLNSRKLDLPDEIAGEVIRFHPCCKFGDERFAAMIALVRNIATDAAQAIHRTALAPGGKKIERDGKTLRMSLGSITGGAIKLDPDETVEQGLSIGEGIESSLSGRQKGLRPVWSAVNTGGIENFPVLPGIEGLHLFAENDENGASRKAVAICGRRWHDAGCDVRIVTPENGKDLNDELAWETVT